MKKNPNFRMNGPGTNRLKLVDYWLKSSHPEAYKVSKHLKHQAVCNNASIKVIPKEWEEFIWEKAMYYAAKDLLLPHSSREFKTAYAWIMYDSQGTFHLACQVLRYTSQQISKLKEYALKCSEDESFETDKIAVNGNRWWVLN